MVHWCFSKLFAKRARGGRVLNFSWSFHHFALNKSRKQNTETRQARRQLHFAPKIIKNRLVVLENELIEVCVLILKNVKKTPRINVIIAHQRSFNKMSINTYIKTWHTRNRFSTFLKLPCKLQSTRSPRLSNGFWCFLVQNEAGTLLVSFLCSVSYFCLVQNNENFKRRLELCFPRTFCKHFGKTLVHHEGMV